MFRDKALKENGQDSPWGKLRHAAGRLLSYFQAVNTLLQARRRWDCLFHEFRVKCLSSSTAISNPISRKKVTGSDIIGRMTPDQGKAADFKRRLHDLQLKFDVDGEIQEKVQTKNFQPIVHAELLVHESIVNDPDPDISNLHPSKFFDGNRYIGSSKPTCRLCQYYFRACTDSIRTRETHRNLYPRWRAPDVYKHQGEKAERRERIMNDMLKWIREDAFRTLTDRVPERKTNDSNTDPTYNLDSSLGYAEGWVECIAEGIRQLSTGDTRRDGHVDVSVSKEGLAEADDQDDDDGGVRL